MVVQEARFPAGAVMDLAGLRGDSVFLVTQGTVAIVAAQHPDQEPAPPARPPLQSISSEEFCLEGDVAGELASTTLIQASTLGSPLCDRSNRSAQSKGLYGRPESSFMARDAASIPQICCLWCIC